MTDSLELFVPGIPRPQGSKSARVVKGRAMMFEASKHTKGWRKTVTDAVEAHGFAGFGSDPVSVYYTFVMPRPKALKGHRWATQRPDIEKLARAISDSLSDAGVWDDDSQVVHMNLSKLTAAEGKEPGVHFTVKSLAEVHPF